MQDNAATVARAAYSSDHWRIGQVPVIAAPCRCASPAHVCDELGTRCMKCGRRPRSRAVPDPLAE
jgi:hypothetical protein